MLTQSDVSKTEVTRNIYATSGRSEIHEVKKDTLIVGKNEFILFMVEVMNCSSQTNKKNRDKIKIIVKAAEKYLGIKKLSWETVEGKLSAGISSCQTW